MGTLKLPPGKARPALPAAGIAEAVPHEHRATFKARHAAMAAWNALLFSTPVPMKVGIHRDCRHAPGCPLKPRELNAFLYRWVRHPLYCRRLAAWQHRLGLDGTKHSKIAPGPRHGAGKVRQAAQQRGTEGAPQPHQGGTGGAAAPAPRAAAMLPLLPAR